MAVKHLILPNKNGAGFSLVRCIIKTKGGNEVVRIRNYELRKGKMDWLNIV